MSYANYCRMKNYTLPLITRVIGLALFMLIISALLPALCIHLLYSSELAQIEQARSDLKLIVKSDNKIPPDILSQIFYWNQIIIKYKKYNSSWILDIFSLDEWNDVDLIKIPE